MTRHFCAVAVCLFMYQQVSAQAGEQSFRFVDIPSHARITGLGGVLVSQPGMDINLVLSNPAQSTDTLDGNFSFSYLDYFADAKKFQAAYQHDFGNAGSWFIAVDHLSYGDFDGFDDTGRDIGEFDAGETLLMAGTSRQVGLFRLGGAVKFLSSQIAGYSAGGMAVDLGGTFVHPDQELAVGLVFRNLGIVFGDYDGTSDSSLPFDVQAGVTFKPKFMPLRFSFTAHHLTDWSLDNFDDENRPGTFDQVFRHLAVGTEVLIHKNVELRLGYNHRVRTDLVVENAGGGSGFSYGLVFNMKGVGFAYSRGGYSAASGVNNFTLILDTERVFSKKIKI